MQVSCPSLARTSLIRCIASIVPPDSAFVVQIMWRNLIRRCEASNGTRISIRGFVEGMARELQYWNGTEFGDRSGRDSVFAPLADEESRWKSQLKEFHNPLPNALPQECIAQWCGLYLDLMIFAWIVALEAPAEELVSLKLAR